ncbi:hypothetical protein CASFOL_005076 [Castilleja foliolosa]|uniref:Uncharacterized protein n=1 Tax=Castilleja foliolosa TaxID=1961234 RepID=A0ABD3E2D8_9LAMI
MANRWLAIDSNRFYLHWLGSVWNRWRIVGYQSIPIVRCGLLGSEEMVSRIQETVSGIQETVSGIRETVFGIQETVSGKRCMGHKRFLVKGFWAKRNGFWGKVYGVKHTVFRSLIQ